jgi:hypothetical protein
MRNAVDQLTNHRSLKVRVIIDAGNKEWILGKFADRLLENLATWNIEAEIAEEPSPDVDINHWMFYGYAWGFFFQEKRNKLTKSTMMITHLDDPLKMRMVKEALDQVVDVGICMSRMTMEDLVHRGITRDRLCYVSPAHDGNIEPRRTVIGITSRAYPDGRKREHLLVKLAESLPLDLFHFEIIGSGWDEVVNTLEAAGATVTYYPGTDDSKLDYAYMLERLRTFDFYLYLGLDEGSMGILDALGAGVETIVTRQGFHLDIEDGITHGFLDGSELVNIFRTLRDRRMRLMNGVKGLTWGEYARQHALVWRYLAEDRVAEISPSLHLQTEKTFTPPKEPIVGRAASGLQFYLNAGRSDFRKIYWDRRKWQVRAALSRMKQRLVKTGS